MVVAMRIIVRNAWSSRFSGLCRLLSEAKHREDYDESRGQCIFRRSIHSSLTRLVLVRLPEIARIGKQRRSHWPRTILGTQSMMRRQLCLQSAAILYPVAGATLLHSSRHGEAGEPLRHRHSTDQRDVVVCWAFGACKRLHASVLAPTGRFGGKPGRSSFESRPRMRFGIRRRVINSWPLLAECFIAFLAVCVQAATAAGQSSQADQYYQ